MTNKLTNGDYEKNVETGNLIQVDYIDEVLQNVRLVLTASRGRFYPNKNFGSNLKNIYDNSAEMALLYARQALEDFDGIYVLKASRSDGGWLFTLSINDEERQVTVEFGNNI